jgi:enoyl-CoA hydratase/carnithine racemase
MELSYRLPRNLDAAALSPLGALLGRRPENGSVIVLRGSSPDCFCDGMNLREACGVGAAEVSALAETLVLLAESPVPTVAVVTGSARGGGVGLAAACDVIIAASSATFALPELLFGLVPATIWPLLRRRVSEARLRRWTLTGLAVSSDEAASAGLVDRVVAETELDEAVRQQLRLLRRVRSHGMSRLRQLSSTADDSSLPAAIRRGAQWTASLLEAPDVAQSLAAFEEGGAPWLEQEAR